MERFASPRSPAIWATPGTPGWAPAPAPAPDGSKGKTRLVMLLSVLAVSPDAMCLRFCTEAGVDSTCILVWKMVFTCVLVGSFSALRAGGARALVANLGIAPCHTFALVMCQMAVNLGFTMALTLASAAKVLLLLSLNPLWSALLGSVALKEVLPCRTVCALSTALLGIALIYVPVIATGREADAGGADESLGDALAFTAGVGLALSVTVIRCASFRAPTANLEGASALSAACTALVFCAAKRFTGIMPEDAGFDAGRPVWQFWLVIFADAACVSALYVALSWVPSRIPGPEVGLIMLLEVVMGPFWVFLAYGDVPAGWTLLGGGVLLAALAGHELVALRVARRGGASGAARAALLGGD